MNLTRYQMYKRISEYFKEPIAGKILGISGMENFLRIIDKDRSNITEVNYPEMDMQNLLFQENSFDYVISDQVIEHLEDPQKAINECYRVAKQGGIVIATTCFMNNIHSAPKDFWRFSPDALKRLFSSFSNILQCEGWGNRAAILLCMLGDRFRNIRVPSRKFSLINMIAGYNEKRFPIVTWIIGRK